MFRFARNRPITRPDTVSARAVVVTGLRRCSTRFVWASG